MSYNLKFGEGQEEQQACNIFYNLLLVAKNNGVSKPKTIYISCNEELQSFVMWYALIQGLRIKYTNGLSYVT